MEFHVSVKRENGMLVGSVIDLLDRNEDKTASFPYDDTFADWIVGVLERKVRNGIDDIE